MRACENLNRGLFYWSCYDESGPGGPSFAGFEYSFQLCDWRRGGLMSVAVELTDTGHVPAEPSPTEHKTALLSSLRRRGGQLFGAIGQTDSGHVPTEPKQVLTFARQDAANWGRRLCWCALRLCLDKVSLCWDLCPGPGKLIVSIRQLDDLLDFLDLSNFGAFLLSFDGQLILRAGGITWEVHGISWRWFDVIPPCLSGGLLSTQRGAASLCAALGNLYFASELAGNLPGHGHSLDF